MNIKNSRTPCRMDMSCLGFLMALYLPSILGSLGPSYGWTQDSPGYLLYGADYSPYVELSTRVLILPVCQIS